MLQLLRAAAVGPLEKGKMVVKMHDILKNQRNQFAAILEV